MDAFLERFWWLKSKKVWAFIIGFVTIAAAAFQVEPFPYEDFTMKVLGLVAAFIGGNALEDGMKANAQAKAQTTTVSTPGESDVTVTAPADTHPAQPVIHHTGLR